MNEAAKVGLVVEDQPFVDFLVPAIRRLAQLRGVAVEVSRPVVVGGCRPGVLQHRCGREFDLVDILVLGADAHISGSRGSASHRRKAHHLGKLSGLSDRVACAATAAPSVEAWLLSDPSALKSGLESATGLPFKMPGAWPTPRTEHEAKRDLARVVAEGLGGPQPRSGFEYSRFIVVRMKLLDSADDSLRDWARDFDGRLQRLSSG